MTKVSKLHLRFLLEFVAVLTIVVIPVFVQAGILSVPFSATNKENNTATVYNTDTTLNSTLNAKEVAQGGGDVLVSSGVLLSSGPAGEDEIATTRLTNGEIKVHTVRPCTEDSCETISHIAEMYGVTTNTILWANDITDPTTIQAGDTLVILPIVGVQHEVEDGDTVEKIAKKYEGNVEEILAYNQLSSSASLAEGETIVIPGGRIEEKVQIASNPSSPRPVAQSGSVSSGNGFSHPAPGTIKTQGIHGYNAVDFGGPIGTSIYAAAAGEVIVSKTSGWNGGYGIYIVVRHPNGTQTLYAHNSQNYVGVGEYVSAGQEIGAMGSTGRSTGSHLHFEVRGTRNPF